MTAKEILAELKPLGKESYKHIITTNHGVREPCFGVPVSELKKIQKRIKKNYQLALDLFATGNYDAMYLAGLVADDARMTRQDLQGWADKAEGGSLPGATVAWVAAESPHGWELGRKWIESAKIPVALAGWSTLSCVVALKADGELDLPELKSLIQRVQKTIQKAPDGVRRPMIHFLIAVGCHVQPLTELAIQTGEQLGLITADLGNNNCKMPFAPEYIRKAQQRGVIGKKKKTVKC